MNPSSTAFIRDLEAALRKHGVVLETRIDYYDGKPISRGHVFRSKQETNGHREVYLPMLDLSALLQRELSA